MRKVILVALWMFMAVLCAEDLDRVPKKDLSVGFHVYEHQNQLSALIKSIKMDEPQPSVITSYSLRLFHASNVINFVKMESFGVSRVPRMDETHSICAKDRNGNLGCFVLKQRELIGLVVHPKPVVYEAPSVVTEGGIVSMKMPSNTKTRDMDAFEIAALTKLQNGQDLIARDECEAVRIVGAIRAKQDCLNCHECKEGALLGAFSYRIAHVTLEESWAFSNEEAERSKKAKKG